MPSRELRCHIDVPSPRGRQVTCRLSVDFPVSAPCLWQKVADLPRFLTIDPFHREWIPLAADVRPGVQFALLHEVLGWRFWRFGRLLFWKEGRSYAFSDMSARGPRKGFPHVFFVQVEPLADAATSRLRIQVRGRWTSRLIPPGLARCWLYCVVRDHAGRLQRELCQ